MGGAPDFKLQKKINIAFYTGTVFSALLIPSLLLLLISKFIHLHIIFQILIFITMAGVVLAVISDMQDDFLDLFLSDEAKKLVGFYKVKWRSKEMDIFLGKDILELINDSNTLLKLAKKNDSGNLTDFSFIVLPYAKAFEGVLKKILVEANILTNDELIANPDISVNKYFNPASNAKILELLRDKKRDKAVPYVIFSTYQECRNQILHYDTYRDLRLKTIEDAEFYIRRIDDAMQKAIQVFKNPHNP